MSIYCLVPKEAFYSGYFISEAAWQSLFLTYDKDKQMFYSSLLYIHCLLKKCPELATQV